MKWFSLLLCLFSTTFLSFSAHSEVVTYSVGGFASNGNMQSCAGSIPALTPLATCMLSHPEWDSYEISPSGGIGNLTGEPAHPFEEGISTGPSCIMRSGSTRMVMQICTSIDLKKNIGDDCELPYYGNPVNAATGNKFQKEIDYQPKNLQLDFIRFYNSQFGHIWSNTYSDRIWFNPINTNEATYIKSDGSGIDFVRTGTTWTTSTGIETLVEVASNSWRLTNKNGQVLTFDSTGKLQSIQERSGIVISLSYSVNGTPSSIAPKRGLLISVSDSFGNSLSFTYNAASMLASMVDPAGGTTVYNYDSLKRLVSVTYPDQSTKTYIYGELTNTSNVDQPSLLTGIINEAGVRVSTYRYDVHGRAISTENAEGTNKFEFSYHPEGTDVLLPNGTHSELRFQNIDGKLKTVRKTQPAGAGCDASYREVIHDDNSYTSFDFNGITTTHTYSPDRKLVIERVVAPETSDEKYYKTEWHSLLTLPLRISEPNRRISYTYDETGNILTKTIQGTVDDTGLMGFSAETTGTPSITTYTYNAFGQILSIDEARTDVSDVYTFTYTGGNLSTITNPLGHVTSYIEYNGHGLPGAIIDPNGVRTNLIYSARGWLTGSSIGDVNEPLFSSTYLYDPAGRLLSIESSLGSKIEYAYDEAGRLLEIKDGQGNRTEHLLDDSGNVTQKKVIGSNDVTQYREVILYDNLSRMYQRINANGAIASFNYDANGNVKQATNANGHSVDYAYNSNNLLEKITDPLEGDTLYSYNGQGELLSVKDPNSNETSFELTGSGDVASVLSPDSGLLEFTHDSAGNRVTMVDARNVTVNYTYDALNRLTAVEYPSAPEESVHYSYDATSVDNLGIGHLTGISTSDSTIEYQYNFQGLITKKITTINGLSFVTEYEYDGGGNLTGIVYPSGRRVNYQLDADGRILAITTSKGPNQPIQIVLDNIQYLPFGPASGYHLGNGLTSTYTYNQDYRLEGILTSSSQSVFDTTYNYDAAYNIRGIINNLDASRTQHFLYDPLNRLVQAEGIYGHFDYTYDAVGNRLTQAHQSGANEFLDEYFYSPGSNRLLEITSKLNTIFYDTQSFSYDAAGSVISNIEQNNDEHSYSYNQAYRMTAVQRNNLVAATYTYNPLGQRIRKVLPNETDEIYHYNEAGSLIAVTDSSGSTLREYVYREGHQVALIGQISIVSASPIVLDEASAIYSGNHTSANNNTGYTGSGFIDFVGEGQVSWPLVITDAGSYSIDIRYALASANRPLALLVNGVEHSVINFPPTNSWRTWSTVETTLTLPVGNHTLSLSTLGVSGGNIDRIDVTPLTTSVTESALYFIHSNHLDLPQVVTDENQNIVWTADYEPFGKALNEQSNELKLYNRFPGQYLDEETGLHHNYFRDYDPEIGRYLQSDPIGLQGGLNTYTYAFGNPLSWIDPLGLEVVGTWINEPEISDNWGFRRDRNTCSGKTLADCYWRGIDYGLGMEIYFWIEVMVSEGLIRCNDTELCDEWEVRTEDFYEAHDFTITTPAPGLICGTVAAAGRLQMTPYGCPLMTASNYLTQFGAYKREALIVAEEYLRSLTPEQRARLCKAGKR